MKKVAIFDIDGTIFRSSLLIELVNEMVDEGLFPKDFRRAFENQYAAWLDRRGSYDDYINAVVSAYNNNIAGVDYARFKNVVGRVIGQMKNRVYRYTRDLVRELKSKDYFLLAISHSPMEIVQDFGNGMGFDKVYGRIYVVGDDGKFTGVMEYADLIADKAKILERAREKEDLTLEGSYGVGDSEGDISLLGAVENPVCFNPNRKLYDEAKRRGWKIVVERKDVIYEL
ncbi:MAG: HAD-IB family hydrolase [Patescibacteria group bacterium]|nr:HAD-IB family hydrolase [Patescibacteria group bacterium]